MREGLRRALLFLITIGMGSLIILVDAPVEVILAGTVLAGFFALVITGALDLAELRPSRLKRALRERKKPPEAKKPDIPAEKPSRTRGSGMLGTLAASVRETIAHARAPEVEKKDRIEKIDALLDEAVDGTAPKKPAAPAKAGGDAVDPLASLADLDIDALAEIDQNGESPGPGTAIESDRISADAVSEILKAHQNDLDGINLTPGIDLAGNPDATLPAIAGAPGGDGMPDLSALNEELSLLDDLDLDEIEIEGEEKEEIRAEEPEEVPEEAEEPEEEFDMVSFASGGTVDDDLITSLKSDAKKKKFVEDVSLVRDLKGEKYDARSLALELEEILAAMRSQR
ncbi:MAG TPA: hypothetical protein PLD13_07155 [Methanoculleus sp.]|nr:hypothetical protein [Methanoculleus sp.]